MKVSKPKYKGNMEELNPQEEDDLIANLQELLEQLNWNIAYQIDPESDKIKGIICGQDDFLNNVLTAIDGQNNVDINEMYQGSKEELN